MARLTDLVKTYRLINDPKSPDWNVKFGAAVFVVVLAAAALLAVAYMPAAGEGPGTASPTAANTADGGDGGQGAPETRTEYVGTDLARLDPTALPDPATVQGQLDAWLAEHPGATVLATEPVTSGGQIIGYTIVYRP